jgi:hypothetical protein
MDSIGVFFLENEKKSPVRVELFLKEIRLFRKEQEEGEWCTEGISFFLPVRYLRQSSSAATCHVFTSKSPSQALATHLCSPLASLFISYLNGCLKTANPFPFLKDRVAKIPQA